MERVSSIRPGWCHAEAVDRDPISGDFAVQFPATLSSCETGALFIQMG
jgi:hypothetical protein